MQQEWLKTENSSSVGERFYMSLTLLTEDGTTLDKDKLIVVNFHQCFDNVGWVCGMLTHITNPAAAIHKLVPCGLGLISEIK